MLQLYSIISQIDMFSPQISDFINQFNTIILDNNINVITNIAGNMYVDIPNRYASR